jgi:gas vesicle protein
MENNSSGGGFMFPFVTGLIAGAVVGLLFAPDKGTETRKRLMKTVNNLTDSFSDTFGEGGTSESGSSYQSSSDTYSGGGTSRRSTQNY